MTFTPMDFTNGEVLPAADLDTMDANDDHVREEANYYPLVGVANIATAGYTPNAGASDLFKIKIDGTFYGSGVASFTSGSGSEGDIDISSLSTGIHTIELWEDAFAVTDREMFGTFRFYKSPDMTYLTWWMEIAGSTGDFTVIGHRETKSWV